MGFGRCNMNAIKLWTAVVIISVFSVKAQLTNYGMQKSRLPPDKVQKLIARIKVQIHFETVLYLKQTSTCQDVYVEDAINAITIPKIRITDEHNFYLRSQFAQRVLAIVYVEPFNVFHILHNLTQNLQHMRFTQTLIVVNEVASHITEKRLIEIFKYCEKMQMLNVIAIDGDFQHTGSYYSYHKFPKFQLENHTFRDSSEIAIFPARLRNIYGYPIRTLPEGTRPRTIIHRNKNGTIHLFGFVWQTVKEFARLLNGTVHLTIPLSEETIFYQDMLHYTRNNTLDIAATVTSPMFLHNLHELSYPLTIGQWCVMVPQENQKSRNDIVALLVGSEISTIVCGLQFMYALLISAALCLRARRRVFNCVDFLFNDISLRGVLGQSFAFPLHPKLTLRITLMLLCFTGLFYTTIYSAHYQAYLTRPPNAKRINNLEEMLHSPLKIFISEQEYEIVPAEIKQRYGALFKLTDDLKLFYTIRNNLNTSYAFTVTDDQWLVYKQQQEYFSHKLFRLTDICFLRIASLNIIIPENSIYRERLDQFICDLMAAGFMPLWIKMSFYYMLKSYEVSFKDLSEPWTYIATRLEDCVFIFKFYAVAHIICMICFCSELLLPLIRQNKKQCKVRIQYAKCSK